MLGFKVKKNFGKKYSLIKHVQKNIEKCGVWGGNITTAKITSFSKKNNNLHLYGTVLHGTKKKLYYFA